MNVNNAFKLKVENIEQNFNFFLLTIFLMVGAIGIFNHEMWRDELEAWLIARDSVSVTELLENLKYTGHPSLWYLCLHLLSKITANPLVMQLFHLTIAGGVIFVFLYYSTFNKLQKALFCFGYFPLYEYGVISRSYSFGVLFIFIFCALFCRKKHNYIYFAIVLALLSHTSIYGLIIGVIFAVMLAYEAIIKASAFKIHLFPRRRSKYELVISATIYLVSLFASAIQITPPADAKTYTNISFTNESSNINSGEIVSKSIEFLESLGRVITGIWRSYVPVPNFSIDNFWGSNILADNHQLPATAITDLGSFIAAFMSIVLFSIFVSIFICNYQVLFIYVFGTLSILLFGLTVKLPEIRHNGHLFILLIACFWIHIYETEQDRHYSSQYNIINLINRYQNLLLTIILCIQLYAGIKMYAADLVQVFSNSKNAAQFIQNNRLGKLPIVGSRYKIVSPLSAWLNCQIYYPEIRNFGTFTVWTSKSEEGSIHITQQEILQQIKQLKDRNYDNLLLVLDNRLNKTLPSLNIDFLESYENSIFEEEKYFIYYVN